jgi:hypothetical protein
VLIVVSALAFLTDAEIATGSEPYYRKPGELGRCGRCTSPRLGYPEWERDDREEIEEAGQASDTGSLMLQVAASGGGSVRSRRE